MANYKKPKRMSRKELREPDEVMSKLQLIYELLAKYRNLLILAAVGLVVVLLVASFIVDQLEEGSRAEAAAFDAAFATVRAPVKEQSAEAAEAVEEAAPGTEQFETEAERTQKAVERLEAFLAEKPGGELEDTARLALAALQAEQGKAAEASGAVAEYLADKKDSPLAPILQESLAVAALGAGKIEEAREWFGRLAEAGSPYFKALSHSYLGDLANPAFPAGEGKSAEAARAEYQTGLDALEAGERKVTSAERPLLESLERRVALLGL